MTGAVESESYGGFKFLILIDEGERYARDIDVCSVPLYWVFIYEENVGLCE